MKKCPQCGQWLDTLAYGEELIALYQRNGKELSVLKELIKARGQWVTTSQLMAIAESKSQAAFSSMITSMNRRLVHEAYWVANQWGHGYRLARRGDHTPRTEKWSRRDVVHAGDAPVDKSKSGDGR